MSEVKKLNEEELQAVRAIKREYDNIVFALGEIAIQKSNLLAAHKNLSEKQAELSKQINYKYGSGNINIETGEIVQVDKNIQTRPLPNQ